MWSLLERGSAIGRSETMPGEKDVFIESWEREHATSVKVMGAIPEDKLDFKPHETSWTARQLAWHLVALEAFFIEGCLAGKIEMKPGPPPPDTLREILTAFTEQHRALVERVRGTDGRQLERSIDFYVGPKRKADVPIMAILWMGVLQHAIHHRGQLSVYLRMMGAKVPSIYGPSRDEPWF